MLDRLRNGQTQEQEERHRAEVMPDIARLGEQDISALAPYAEKLHTAESVTSGDTK